MSIIETERLELRELEDSDEDALQRLLSDPEVMAAKGGPRGQGAARQSIERSQRAYKEHGYGMWATVLKESGVFIGVCGLIPQIVDGKPEPEISYTLAKMYWGRGLATEAARAIKRYAFGELGLSRVISLITADNLASLAVARKNGLRYERDVIFKDFLVGVYAASRHN